MSRNTTIFHTAHLIRSHMNNGAHLGVCAWCGVLTDRFVHEGEGLCDDVCTKAYLDAARVAELAEALEAAREESGDVPW